ncbi:MAG: prevent-host-death family protein [Rhodospirillales bacterium RIFCSPLOWO2_12_FULL_58_28]|nr:MAG: prevent-host-death family protein [Rhodospirillales bacterium RIFCSPLOWO2_02_FULL_58_16]OHC78101.1 MAG: prevent-host-death family protein [Rhodospirillales bacterium RIFCSPLOWO2_12_FULL_58_28]
METFSIRDLRERTGELVRNAEAGHLALVAKHGHPLFVAVPLDEHLLESGIAVALACRLFAEKVISLGKAARLAGLSNEAFIERLGAIGIPAVDYAAGEIDGELDLLAG